MSLSFTEAKLEHVILTLLEGKGYLHSAGKDIERADKEEVLILADIREYLARAYKNDHITQGEISGILRDLLSLSALDVYASNKAFCTRLANGFLLKREDRSKKDLYIQLFDTEHLEKNIFRVVNQLEIEGRVPGAGVQMRIPDAILYVNGFPLVLFEFKSTVREEATIYDAFLQITKRYRRDIPKLFVYNALCVLSDGVNSVMGNVFAPYEYFSAWRKVTGDESVEKQGIESLHTMIDGLFEKARLLDVIKNFIYFPDTGHQEVKICCRYPQYYAANKLFRSIQRAIKPKGGGKGGTYFGATGCGKSFTMLFLCRLLMKSVALASPSIVLITDRIDLDEQLSKQFVKAKTFIGDEHIVAVESRTDLGEQLRGRSSGGVFLTTIHKFTEDLRLLSERTNIICIADEAHRSQVNLEQKVRMDEKKGVLTKRYGFAKYLHDSLPNATYVGFTGTPIDATLAVFGDMVDSYTMTESVNDGITVRIVYEGRAAKVFLDADKAKDIDAYYNECLAAGANEYQVEESKRASATMQAIFSDPKRIALIAEDFVTHYETRMKEGSTVRGKAMFVCYAREIAYLFYKELQRIRPQWFEVLSMAEEVEADSLSQKERKSIVPSERVRMVMSRSKDDDADLYSLLGTREHKKSLDEQFKNAFSNFKIAIVVDMWLTGFDVPSLDTIYIDKPLQRHSLIQTISRVNRTYEGKSKGLVVDYIGIKSQMNLALAQYSKGEGLNFEEIDFSIKEVRDHLDLLAKLFHGFDNKAYFKGEPAGQFACLNKAAEFVLATKARETQFMGLVRRLRAAYDICCAHEALTTHERDFVHFYAAVRSIVFKLTKSDALDTAQMNKRVQEMIEEALRADGVQSLYTLGEGTDEVHATIDIFDNDYLALIDKIKLPNTKIMLLQKLLQKAIAELKKKNKLQAVIFSEKLAALVDKYNERKENNVLRGEEFEPFTEHLLALCMQIKDEMAKEAEFEGQAFYDILLHMSRKYDFTYSADKMRELAIKIKNIVEDKAKYPDWNQRLDIKAELKADIIILLAEYDYPPVAHDAVYAGVLEQAQNYKKNL